MSPGGLQHSSSVGNTELNALFSYYTSRIIDFTASTRSLQEWPEHRQTLLDLLSVDVPCILSLPVIANQAVGGEINQAIPITVAWCALRYASDILDAIQDGHALPITELDTPTALGYATGLIFSAFRLVNDLKPLEVSHQINTLFAEAGFYSSIGQFEGLKSGQKEAFEEAMETYWHATILKSGSIFRAGLAAGAMTGTNSEREIVALGDFGNALGVIRQIMDDCRDVLEGTQNPVAWNGVTCEPTLPYLLWVATSHVKQDRTWSVLPLSEAAILNDLIETKVPEIIADVLMEWRQRALESLVDLVPSKSMRALEYILQIFITSPSLN